MKRFRAHIRPLLLTCVIVLFFVSLLNITTSFAQDAPFARLKTAYGSAPILSLSPDGQTLATTAERSDYEVHLWDVATGTRLPKLTHLINRRSSALSGINFISFISDRTLLSATDTSSIYLWDVSETFSFGTLLKREEVPGDNTTNFLLSPDGQTLAYYADNDHDRWERSVYLWDISDSTLLKEFRDCSDVFSFSRDSQTFLTHCGTRVDLWDVSDSKFLASFDTEFEDQVSAMSPDGKTLVLTGRHTGLLRTLDLWDVSEDTLLQKIGIYSSSRIGDISFSPDGQTLAVSSLAGSFPDTVDLVDLWDISTGELRNTFKHSELDSYNPPHILFSPDGQTLLSGLPSVHGYAGLGLWDVATGRLRNVFQGSTEVRSISFISDAQIPGGQILATAHETPSSGRLPSWNTLEILLWRVGPAVPAEPELVAAKSLLEEFIGLKDPFAAVAGVAPPFNILDAADATNLRVNWEDIAKGVEDYEGNESLDVNQDGSVNERDLQLVEFALTLDTDGDGTLRVQEMVSPHESPDLVVESITLQQGDNEETKSITVNPGEKFNLYVSFKNKGAATDNKTRALYYRSTNKTFWENSTPFAEGETVSLSGDIAVHDRKLSVIAPNITGTYNYGVCVDSVPNEIDTTNNCSAAVRVFVKAGLPPLLIENVAHSADGYTYFVVNPQPAIALPLEFYPSKTLSRDKLDKFTASDAIRKVTECSVTLHTPASGYFMFPLESPQGQKTAAEETADQAEETLKFGLSIIGQLPEELGKKGNWFDKLRKGVIKAASKALSLLQIIGVVIDVVIGIVAPENPTDPPKLTVKPPSNFFEALGREAIDKFLGLENYRFEPFLPPMLFMIRDDLSSIDITVEQKYEVEGMASHYRWEKVPWKLKNSTRAAPNARPMSLADYPPFQQLPPEAQEYLLQHFEGTSNHKAINAEAWQVPETTTLLPNYPNPFNPETWIPYQLANPADVTLTIHAVDGKLVRALDLGHQRAGMYQSQARAAHWDGRNAQGESVASGLYFYTLTAGDFSATRKMLIRK